MENIWDRRSNLTGVTLQSMGLDYGVVYLSGSLVPTGYFPEILHHFEQELGFKTVHTAPPDGS